MLLDDYLKGGTPHGNEVSYDCPFCVVRGHSPDVEEKLWVNYDKEMSGVEAPGVYFCYRCEAKGTLDYLLKWLGAERPAAPAREQWDQALRILYRIKTPQSAPERAAEASQDYTGELIELGCYPVMRGSIMYDYLVDRGVDTSDIEFYRMLEGRGRYHNRVIVPTFDSSRKIPFFVARAIRPLFFTDDTGRKIEAPKYFNPKGEGRKWSIFNLQNAIQSDTVIVTEGVFSSIAAGRNAVATFGKLVTTTQVDLLVASAAGREIVVCMDADAHPQGVNLAARLADLGMKASFVLLPGDHDPATLSRTELDYFLKHRYPYDATEVIKLQVEGTFKCRSAKPRAMQQLVGPSVREQLTSSISWLQRGSSRRSTGT